MIIPAWFLLALGSSILSAMGMYMHQRLGGSNVATAVWMKIFAVMIAVPVLAEVGLPSNPMFYLFTALASIIWCFNDLIYFEAVKNHGAALLSRLGPLGIILGFVAWFFVHPELLYKYTQDMPRFAGVCGALFLTVLSAAFLKRCQFSASALRTIWPIIIAAAIGILLLKSAVDYAPENQGVFGYVGFEAGMMLIFYTIYFSAKRRAAFQQIFSKEGLKTGALVGLLLVGAVILRTYAHKNVDHPAFVNAIGMLDVIWLIILTRVSGWKDDSNKIAGLGIIVAALMIAFLKI